MTEDRFDALAKTLGKTASRRTVFKGVLAAALGGLLARASADDADAFRGRRGCGRLGQDCGGTNPGCCSGLTCDDATSTCLTSIDEPCLEDSDCAGAAVCGPFGSFSFHCCIADGDACSADTDCCSGACDPSSGTCLLGVGEACLGGASCATNFCDPYTLTCTDFCTGETGLCFGAEECCDDLVCAPPLVFGFVPASHCMQCLDNGAECTHPLQCCGGACFDSVCLTCLEFGETCNADGECCSGSCVSGSCSATIPK